MHITQVFEWDLPLYFRIKDYYKLNKIRDNISGLILLMGTENIY